MIYHPKVIFVENPRTASSYIADLLLEDGGERLTPRHGALAEPSPGVPSFVVVRNPYQRAASSWKYLDSIDQNFPKLLDWMEGSDHPFATVGQLEMTANVDHVFKYEELSKVLPAFFEEIGLGHLTLDIQKSSSHRLRKVDKEKVAEVFRKDFTELKYKV